MAYKIIVKKRFTSKIVKLLAYIEAEWGKRVADNLTREIDQRLDMLSQQPFIGAPADETKFVRSVLIGKYNKLYYRVRNDTIEIINLYDTRMNPKKNPYKRK